MVCLYCGAKKTAVANSRAKKRTNEVWRRRACVKCKAIFTSVEGVDLATALLVEQKAGHFEPFQRDKLFVSVYDCLKHRKNALEAATGLTATVIAKLTARSTTPQLKRADIIKTAKEVLNRYDKAAAVQFNAYHPL